MQELEDRLTRTEAKAEVYEGKHAAAQKTMNALKVGIQNIFNRIGCATPAVKELLGDVGVTEGNMMQVRGRELESVSGQPRGGSLNILP